MAVWHGIPDTGLATPKKVSQRLPNALEIQVPLADLQMLHRSEPLVNHASSVPSPVRTSRAFAASPLHGLGFRV